MERTSLYMDPPSSTMYRWQREDVALFSQLLNISEPKIQDLVMHTSIVKEIYNYLEAQGIGSKNTLMSNKEFKKYHMFQQFQATLIRPFSYASLTYLDNPNMGFTFTDIILNTSSDKRYILLDILFWRIYQYDTKA